MTYPETMWTLLGADGADPSRAMRATGWLGDSVGRAVVVDCAGGAVVRGGAGVVFGTAGLGRDEELAGDAAEVAEVATAEDEGEPAAASGVGVRDIPVTELEAPCADRADREPPPISPNEKTAAIAAVNASDPTATAARRR